MVVRRSGKAKMDGIGCKKVVIREGKMKGGDARKNKQADDDEASLIPVDAGGADE